MKIINNPKNAYSMVLLLCFDDYRVQFSVVINTNFGIALKSNGFVLMRLQYLFIKKFVHSMLLVNPKKTIRFELVQSVNS